MRYAAASGPCRRTWPDRMQAGDGLPALRKRVAGQGFPGVPTDLFRPAHAFTGVQDVVEHSRHILQRSRDVVLIRAEGPGIGTGLGKDDSPVPDALQDDAMPFKIGMFRLVYRTETAPQLPTGCAWPLPPGAAEPAARLPYLQAAKLTGRQEDAAGGHEGKTLSSCCLYRCRAPEEGRSRQCGWTNHVRGRHG